MQFLAPVQATCNYMTLFLRNIASSLSDNIGTGTVLRFVLVSIDNDIAGGEGAPSSLPYTSYGSELGRASGGESDHGPLHVDPYPEHRVARGDGRVLGRQRAVLNANTAVIGNPTNNVGQQHRERRR